MASQKSSRWQSGKVDCPVDRRNGHIYDRCASDRPPGRPATAIDRPPGRLPGRSRGVLSVGRPCGRSAFMAGHMHVPCAHRSTVPVDRPLVRSTGSVDRQLIWVGI